MVLVFMHSVYPKPTKSLSENRAITLLVAGTTQNPRALPFVPGIFHCNGATHIPVVLLLAIPEYADPHRV
jgi:hypothetical protein